MKVAPNLLKLSIYVAVGGLWETLEAWADIEKREKTVWSPRLSHIYLSNEYWEDNASKLETFLRHRIDAIGQGGREDGLAKLQVEVERNDFIGVSAAAWSRLRDLEGDGGLFELRVLDQSCSVSVQNISSSAPLVHTRLQNFDKSCKCCKKLATGK
jgi:hypothetical protein